MPTVASVWILAAAAGAGAGLVMAYPPLGVVLAVAATTACGFAVVGQNVPRIRLGYYASLGGLALALYLATGSLALAVAVLALGLPLHAVEPVLRYWRGLHNVQPLLGLLVGSSLLIVARESRWWLLATVPLGMVALVAGVSNLAALRVGRSAVRRAKLSVGRPMPALELPYRAQAGTFRLAEQRGHHVLLCFVRGDWCPVCHVLMRIIMREAPLLRRCGVHVVLVTPSGGNMDEALRAGLGIEAPMVLDEGAQLASELGLIEGQRKGEPVPLPVALLIGPDGVLLDISRPDDVTAFTTESRIASILRARPPAEAAGKAGER